MLQALEDAHRHIVDLVRELLEHGRVEEEPDSVGEEEVALGGEQHHVEEILSVLQVALQVEGAELWDEELKVVSEDASEVWVHSALLEVLDGPWLVSVHPHHGSGYFSSLLFLSFLVEVQPLLEPPDEGLLRHSFRLLAADAAAEHVVETAARSEEAA